MKIMKIPRLVLIFGLVNLCLKANKKINKWNDMFNTFNVRL